MAPLLLLASIVVLSGCATSGNPAVSNEGLISQIKIGVSTKDDVRRLLGQPNVVSRGSSAISVIGTIQSATSETWNYTYVNVESSPATFIPIVGLFAGSATAQTDSVTVTFDDKGIVQHITTGHSQATAGPGASQFQ